MSLFQTLNQSPTHINKFYSPKARPTHPGSYQQYFDSKINQKNPQRRKQESSSAKQNKMLSKQASHHRQRSKLSKGKQSNHKKSQSRPKKLAKDYRVDPMYASRISQLLSQISVPVHQQKITKKELRQLQNKIMSEILALREQKIFALEGLNHVVDKKNKAIQLLKGYEVLKQSERLNRQEEQEQYARKSKLSAGKQDSYQSPISRHQYQESRISKKSSRPAELINSKLSSQVHQIQNAFAQATKIREELMRPLIENPLLLKNNELKAQFQQLKQQLESSQDDKSSINDQIQHYRSENQSIIQELERQRVKLSSIQHKRFETFFPKDKQKIDQMRRMIEVQKDLESKKEQLEQQLLNGTIIRKAQDELVIEELKQESRQLLLNCQRIQMNRVEDGSSDVYSSMSFDELQDLMDRQMQNKRIFDQLMTQFKQKIEDLQRENMALKRRKTRISYYY